MNDTLDKAYTTREAMVLLGCGRNKLWRLLNNGELAAFRVGRQIRISASAINTYKQQAAFVPPEKPAGTDPDDLSLDDLDG